MKKCLLFFVGGLGLAFYILSQPLCATDVVKRITHDEVSVVVYVEDCGVEHGLSTVISVKNVVKKSETRIFVATGDYSRDLYLVETQGVIFVEGGLVIPKSAVRKRETFSGRGIVVKYLEDAVQR